MSRWHLPSCDSPHVILDGPLPLCQACGAKPDLGSLISKPQTVNTFSQPPPDEPAHRLNLHWPPGVPYVSQSERGQHGLLPSLATSLVDFQPSPVYQRRLQFNEFRVIRLDGVPDADQPLHVELETHLDGSDSEYDATSYTWAGENGDSSLSQPIFIGPYWDVLIQTKNCWEMLKYFRPWGGQRRIWVDAICINQRDDSERNAQVAKMAQIYTHCRRVLVYLGRDSVHPTSPHMYPGRQLLEHHMASQQVRELLLNMRYFSRIWIFQEMLLPKQVTMPLGDLELWADHMTGRELASLTEEPAPLPWMIHIAQGGNTNKNTFELVRDTWSMQASDPRDRLFGVLALSSDGDVFQPDYSLSCRHIFGGFFAYYLLRHHRLEILSNAAGLSAPEGYASWMPDWKTLNFSRVVSEDSSHQLAADAFDRWGSWMQQKEDYRRGWYAEDSRSLVQLSSHQSRARRLPMEPQDEYDHEIYMCGEYGVPANYFVEELQATDIALLAERVWHTDAAVTADDGGLRINLTHLLQFQTVPVVVYKHKSMYVFRVEAPRNNSTMYLVSDRPLHFQVTARTDHLYVLDGNNDSSFLLLVLRDVGPGSLSNTTRTSENPPRFKLIGCCYQLYFRFTADSWCHHFRESKHNRHTDEWSHWLEHFMMDRGDEKLFLYDLYNRATGKPKRVPLWVRVKRDLDWKLIQTMFPGDIGTGICARQLACSPFLVLFGEQNGLRLDFLDFYSRFLNQRLNPVIIGDYVQITIGPSDRDITTNKRFFKLYKEMRDEGEQDWKSSRIVHYSPFQRTSVIYLRASRADVRNCILQSKLYRGLATMKDEDRREVDSFLRSVVVDQDWEGHDFIRPDWPLDIIGGFGIDGAKAKVIII
ncbi:hypothetical protein LCI18_004145 [Fusarium solani-melongenae]|uniref:Uncharacterized protein n=1 Tax=Fusarium solani subsp. cucurbitae TaxID=2747967 RepID=A0ACD3YW68_FUSSC|nr:hypothetical protein LCI18_004145 [Fusarium solani-melongenae]